MVRFAVFHAHPRGRLSETFGDQTFRRTFGTFPVKAVLLTRCADDFLGVYRQTVLLVRLGIFKLGCHIPPTNIDRAELISANPSGDDFHLPFRRIEMPLAILTDKRNGKGPIVFANG